MDLKRKIELAQQSNQRMLEAIEHPHNAAWLNFMIRESWINFKRAFEVWLHVTWSDKK
jgi:hypothetical protein